MAKVIYACDKKILSISNTFANKKFIQLPYNWYSCQHQSDDYWAGDTLGDETPTSSGINLEV